MDPMAKAYKFGIRNYLELEYLANNYMIK